MAQQRTRFRTATLVASTNPLNSIKARRLIVAVRHTVQTTPKVISMFTQEIRKDVLQEAY